MSVLPDTLFDRVADVLHEAAQTAVLPRFRRLRDGDVVEKAKDELVTVADREAEALIAPQLLGLLPGSRVVGEEACAAEPALLQRLDEGWVWLVDPLDGTANFVAGVPVFATMAALLHDGMAVGAWVLHPLSGERWVAQHGAGTWCDGERVTTSGVTPPPSAARGAVLTRFLPPELRERIAARRLRVGECLPGQRCAGVEYPLIARGEQQFALFWRTLPWDHVPGTLLLSEAGGHVARFDGQPYRAADEAKGLLAAASLEGWAGIRDALLGTD